MVAMGAAPQIYAASIGIQDSVFLMLLALVVFGPRRLPEIGRQIGKLMYEFRKVSNDFKFQMEEELRASEEAERQRKLQASLPPPAAPEVTPQPLLEAEPAPSPDAPYAIPPEETAARALESEMRGEPGSVPPSPQIQPPSTGEQVAAARPFRASSPAESETTAPEISTLETPAQPVAETATAGEVHPGAQPEIAADSETHHG